MRRYIFAKTQSRFDVVVTLGGVQLAVSVSWLAAALWLVAAAVLAVAFGREWL